MISSFSTMACIKSPTTVTVTVPTPGGNVPSTKMPIVIVGTGSNYTYGYSSNLTEWTWGNIGSTYSSFLPASICCGNVNSESLWVAIGKNGTTYLSSTSTNGTTWSTPSSSISGIFNSTGFIYNGLNFGYDKDGYGIFLATGYGGTSGSSSVAISSDGLNWVVGGYPFALTSYGNNCYYGNGYWVVVGNSGSTTTCVKYSSNISIAGNSSITWSSTGSTFTNPAYGVAYTGSRWVIGTNSRYYFYNSTSIPTSFVGGVSIFTQYPTAIMANEFGNVVAGGLGTSNNLYYLNKVTNSATTTTAITTTRTNQIEYVKTTTMWIAAMQGTLGGNQSLYYSTTAERETNSNWLFVSAVNTNLTNCIGVAAAR